MPCWPAVGLKRTQLTGQILTKRCLRELRLLHHFRGHKNVSYLPAAMQVLERIVL